MRRVKKLALDEREWTWINHVKGQGATMYEFRDPSGRGRVAIIAVLVWLAADLLSTIGSAVTISTLNGMGPTPETADAVARVTGIIQVLATLGSVVFVARWILRVNANAHSWSDSMAITPGWNVGWFFVPIALLWKPFQGLRETWQASISPHDPGSVEVPALMRWWWGLWLATNFIGNFTTRLSFTATDADTLATARWLDIVSFAIDVPLVFVLITMIRRFDALQARGPDYAETFA